MDAGAYGLDLAHPLPDGDALGGGTEKTVHVVCIGSMVRGTGEVRRRASMKAS